LNTTALDHMKLNFNLKFLNKQCVWG